MAPPPDQPWAHSITHESFDDCACATLVHLFSAEKREVKLESSYADHGVLEVNFLVPYHDGDGLFMLIMVARAEDPPARVWYNIPPVGPFAGMGAPLARAIAIELVIALCHRFSQIFAFTEIEECRLTFAPLLMCTTVLCEKLEGPIRVADTTARLYKAAWHGTKCSPYDQFRLFVAQECMAAARRLWHIRLVYTTHVVRRLLRWKERTMHRMYAPGGSGSEVARAHFVGLAQEYC
jgi:hypothetical protein